ncbi:MAG: TFIIB-type zinc finger domain-containing protein [Oligoflexia bacterium]|nr:TFIIB-type zinc finger domain-containing protein [Oligoflexia bacterium]
MEANIPSKHINRKEFECRDCGFLNFVSIEGSTYKCQNCGNIELFDLAKEKSIQEHKTEVVEPIKTIVADGRRVQKIIERYQTEWQMWSALVGDFSNHELHAAYLSISLLENKVDVATERYKKHRSVMVLSGDTYWQAEIADHYLEKLSQLAFVRVEQEGRKWNPLPEWLYLLPQTSPVLRIGWIVLGILLVAKIFRYI